MLVHLRRCPNTEAILTRWMDILNLAIFTLNFFIACERSKGIWQRNYQIYHKCETQNYTHRAQNKYMFVSDLLSF